MSALPIQATAVTVATVQGSKSAKETAQEVREANAALLADHQASFKGRDEGLDTAEQARRQASLLAQAVSETYGDRVDNERFQVYLKARRKADKVLETYCFNDGIPFYFARYLGLWSKERWDLVTVYNNGVNPASYTAQELTAAANIVRRKRNREHEHCYIVLHEENTVTCEETGISFTCRLPIPAQSQAAPAANLSTLHPLSSFIVVEDVIRRYYKTGIRLEAELDSQVLAGMLITILKHKGLLFCKDYVKANLYLQAATPATLSYAVRYFHNLPSTLGMVGLALNLEDRQVIRNILKRSGLSEQQQAQQQAEVQLLNYMKAVKGESYTDDPAIAQPKPKDKAKVRLYSDPVVSQSKNVKAKMQQASLLLSKLDKSAHPMLFELLRTSIKNLVFLSDKVKQDVAQRLVTAFPGNDQAFELSRIFADIATDKLEDDLLTFTQQIEHDKQPAKKTKLSFAALIAAAQQAQDSKKG